MHDVNFGQEFASFQASSNTEQDSNINRDLPSERRFSTIRKCRSQDDILMINKFLNDSECQQNPNQSFLTHSNDDRISDRTFLNMSLMYEREKLCGRSFKDYKAMKSYFENLIRHPGRKYKHVSCECEGACACGTCGTHIVGEDSGTRSLRIRSADDKFLAKSYTYLTNLKLWKSTENSL